MSSRRVIHVRLLGETTESALSFNIVSSVCNRCFFWLLQLRRVCVHWQWRRSQVKSGEINIEKIEGVGSGEGGALPSPVGGLEACPRKKLILRQKLCNSEQVLVLLSYITAESGGIIPCSPESGGPIPLSPRLLRRL